MTEGLDPCKRLEVVLIRPAKYDDDGYVIRYWKGVLPSNTLCCLYSLTEEVAQSGRFAGKTAIRVHTYDETVERVEVEKIARRLEGRGTRVLVGLVGVQTNQFPRASDLAKRFLAAGCKVMIGGFHVSGALAMSPTVPVELQELLDLGVTLVRGEVENVWGDILEDVIEDRCPPIYNICERPELGDSPIPRMHPRYLDRFVYKHYTTVDTSRGCPFGCSFCTVINVQGRAMRFRSPELILKRVREDYRGGKGIVYYFFTDDNLARNKHWETMFDGMIRMREEEGIEVHFLMQVDVKAHRIPNFARKSAEAGCTQVFIGIESVDPENLKGAGKNQNSVDDYAEMSETWNQHGVHVHGAYIIGFPNDTYESVMEAVDRLKYEIKVDQVSFFMLTPIPGSEDHAKAVATGMAMNSDYNEFDSFHAVNDHPKMSREEWKRAYDDAWTRFYTLDNMKEVMLRTNVRNYWGMFKGLLWYRASMLEGQHPMLTGFFRYKDRTERRPGCAIDSRWAHFRKRLPEVRGTLRDWAKLFFEMQELWLQTRVPTEKVGRLGYVVEHMADLQRFGRDARQRLVVTVAGARASLDKNLESIRAHVPHVPGGQRIQAHGRAYWRRAAARISLLTPTGYSTRQHLDRYWEQTRRYWKRGAFWRINPLKVTWNFCRDLRLSFSFTWSLLGERVF